MYNGVQWVPSDGNAAFWKITGNSGTNPPANFIGTTDNNRLVFKTNNTEQATIATNGNVGIGIVTPLQALHISGTYSTTVGSGQLRQSNITTAGGYGGGVNNPAFNIIQPNIRIDAFGNQAGFSPTATYPTNSYPRYVGVDANGDLTVMHPRAEYYHVIQNARLLAVTSSAFTPIPNVTQSITVPVGQVAEVYVTALIGFRNPSLGTGYYNTVDAAIHVDGVLLSFGGYSRTMISNDFSGANAFATSSLNTVVVLGPGTHVIDLRCARNASSAGASVDMGGNGSTDTNAGEMTLIINYR
jgi:hypothetical protein